MHENYKNDKLTIELLRHSPKIIYTYLLKTADSPGFDYPAFFLTNFKRFMI